MAEPKEIAAAEEQAAASQLAAPVLADGMYPTYVRKVDVRGAQMTADVIQVFENEAAAAAAIEDGTPPSEAQYLYIYIRNPKPAVAHAPGRLRREHRLRRWLRSPPEPGCSTLGADQEDDAVQ
jgi:hypothetical protein